MRYSSKMNIHLLSLVLVGLISDGTALICRQCDGPLCISAPTALNLTCSGSQDTCLSIRFAAYAIRGCAVNSMMCNAAGFKTNMNAQYGEIQNYFTNSLNRAVLDADISSALVCCNSDYCNGGMTTTGSLVLLLATLGLALTKLYR